MSPIEWGLDGAIAALLLGLVARILLTRDLFQATVLFIAFGLTLALAWVRLGATDIALAEAALGAGVTGALFLTAFHRLARADGEEPEEPEGAGPHPPREGAARDASPAAERGVDEAGLTLTRPLPRTALWLRGALVAAGTALAGGLVVLIVRLPDRTPLLPVLVAERLDEIGVSNPVTAVLLGFRAYDTLLEVAVLVVAMVGVWSLDRGGLEFVRDPEELRDDPVLHGLSRAIVPVAGVTAVYLVWVGSHGPGGAFQAAALLAGTGVLLVAAGLLGPVTAGARATRGLGVGGLAIFLALGVGVIPWTGSLLAYPSGSEYGIILAVEAVLTVSIAVVLVELFVDVPAVPRRDPGLARIDPTGDPLGRAVSPDGALIRGGREEE